MSESNLTATQVLDRYYLETRGKLLEVAANLDRIDRAQQQPADNESADPRQALLLAALNLLVETKTADRAERLQMHFSDEYHSDWLENWPELRAGVANS